MTALRRVIHKGSIIAAGLFIDTELAGEAEARERLLPLTAGGAVFRCGALLAVRFAEPRRLLASESPGGLLVRYGELLSSAPLEKGEIEAAARGSEPRLCVVRGGEPVLYSLGEASREDPVSWLDVSDFQLEEGTAALGQEEAAPRAGAAPSTKDVRAVLGAPPRPAEEEELLLALKKSGGEDSAAGDGAAKGRPAPVVFQSLVGRPSLLGRFFAGIAGVLARLLPRPRSSGKEGFVASLAVHPDAGPTGFSLAARLLRSLRTWSLRFLLWSNLARFVGQRQADYLRRMMEMFDRGDLDAALRHAISLGGDGGGGEFAGPALGTPSPRKDLTISPQGAGAGAAILSGPLLFEELRRRYREAFEQLEADGEIEKAAFVLAELLGALEEAVAFLEKHGRLRLAAEIAEARRLSPGLVVRQWFLAGERGRAVRLARVHGVFADAVYRLEAGPHRDEAAALRLLWADALASAGNYAAAVEAIWPVEAARHLAAGWLDRAIALGGPSGARMAVRKARVSPSSFAEARDRIIAFVREPGEDGLLHARALAAELDREVHLPFEPLLAKPVVRALLASEDVEDHRRADELLRVCHDPLLREDVRLARRAAAPPRRAFDVTAAALTDMGPRRSHNEDTCLVSLLSRRRRPGLDAAEGSAARDGVVLGVFDGLGGFAAGDVASLLARDVVLERLEESFSSRSDEEGWGEALRSALAEANAAIYRKAMSEPQYRGCGSTAAVASAVGGTLFIAHVGDCRVYLRREGSLVQVTKEHSLLNEYLLTAQLSPEEIANFPHKSIITRALGIKDTVEVDLTSVELCDGDVVMICSDGLWDPLPDKAIGEVLSAGGSPASMCEELLKRCLAEYCGDNISTVVARFSAAGASASDRAAGAPRPATARARVSPNKNERGPLQRRGEVLVIDRAAHDAGAVSIFDAAELPDGKLLVALGELGARLVSREGRTLRRFNEPAHELVMSDHGDRALALGRRGESLRVARLDLAGGREQPWCDVRLSAYATDFDGSAWYVGRGDALYAIDATSSGWEQLWQLREKGAQIRAVARDDRSLSALFAEAATMQAESGGVEVWSFDLPSHKLRARVRARHDGGRFSGALSPGGTPASISAGDRELGAVSVLKSGSAYRALPPYLGQQFLRLYDGWVLVARHIEDRAVVHLLDVSWVRVRARVELRGASRAGGRISRDRAVLFDDRGRLLVVSLLSSKVLRELRVA